MPTAEGTPPAAGPLPDGFGLVLDATVRTHDDGRLLIGGRPRRVLRLSPSGAAVLRELLGAAGGPRSSAGGLLARRLVDAGVAHPVPPPGAGDVGDVTVVIPVRDRPGALARCLAALAGHPRVVVVDDGSAGPGAVRSAADAAGARTLRLDASRGPAAARNAALAAVDTPLVAFLDSDCVPPPGWLAPLVAHLEDPSVGAVAPRVRGVAAGDALGSPAAGHGPRPRTRPTTAARWGAVRSPLDLGTGTARIAPGTPVAYAPTAALVVRRAALGDGFDPALRYGEDVDLVWRLHDAGWTMRYEPAVVVAHEEPASWGAFLARRRHYGASAGPLARRHGRRLAPVVLPPWPTLAAGLLLGRRPRAAALVLTVEAARTERRLRGPGVPAGTGARAALRTAVQTLDGLARTGAMLGPVPLVGLAAARRRARLPVFALLLGAPLARWAGVRRAGRTGGLDPLRWTAASLADDAAYGAGVWAGAIAARSPWALRPAVPGLRWPSGLPGVRARSAASAPAPAHGADAPAPPSNRSPRS